jgi:plastocyanin
MRINIIPMDIFVWRTAVSRIRCWALVLSLSAFASAGAALAQDSSFTLSIKDHRFEPSELQVPAGKKIRLIVKNLDPTPEEFESHDLKREKIIPGKSEATILIGPLKPGTYKFVGEFHESTAKGSIVAK